MGLFLLSVIILFTVNEYEKCLGLPWWFIVWEFTLQCRKHWFDPWSGKIPHAGASGPMCHEYWASACYILWSPAREAWALQPEKTQVQQIKILHSQKFKTRKKDSNSLKKKKYRPIQRTRINKRHHWTFQLIFQNKEMDWIIFGSDNWPSRVEWTTIQNHANEYKGSHLIYFPEPMVAQDLGGIGITKVRSVLWISKIRGSGLGG